MEKKYRIWIFPFIIMGLVIMLTSSCKKDDDNNNNPTVPVLTTSAASDITQSTATCGGNVTSDGGATVTARGVCWNTSSNPLATGSHTTDDIATGVFTSLITGLTAGTKYFVRAYATNSVGTAYGNEVSFTTSAALAIGQSYQGGIIAYILQSGDPGYSSTTQHGFIAAPGNQTSTGWGCRGTLITGTGIAIGTGQANTTAIVNGCSTAGIAARLCDQLELNGYSDWYLPSKDELNQMYQNLHKQGLGNFTKFLYWSSSQIDENNVWTQNFDGSLFQFGGQYNTSKEGNMPVRAIRAF